MEQKQWYVGVGGGGGGRPSHNRGVSRCIVEGVGSEIQLREIFSFTTVEPLSNGLPFFSEVATLN